MGFLSDIIANLCGVDVERKRAPKKEISYDPRQTLLRRSSPEEGSATPIYHIGNYRSKTRTQYDPETLVTIYTYIQKPLQNLDQIDNLDTLQERVEEVHKRIDRVYHDPEVRGIITQGDYAGWEKTIETLHDERDWRSGVIGLQILNACININRTMDVGEGLLAHLRAEKDSR